jgi:hypothetical protein
VSPRGGQPLDATDDRAGRPSEGARVYNRCPDEVAASWPHNAEEVGAAAPTAPPPSAPSSHKYGSHDPATEEVGSSVISAEKPDTEFTLALSFVTLKNGILCSLKNLKGVCGKTQNVKM